MALHLPPTVSDWTGRTDSNTAPTVPPPSTILPHPKADEIIRQVEYYFSDENLPHDAHLLAMSGGHGNGPASLSHIMSFKKMKKFKPMTAVREALKQSTLVEITADGKSVKRRYPLTIRPTVIPKMTGEHVASERRADLLAQSPHLSKGMLKPTGFEEYYTDAPLTPEQYAKQKELYDPEEHRIYERIETAIQRYKARRKMHEGTLKTFEKWMNFGGVESGQRHFGGGLTQQDLGELDKEEIEKQRATNFVAEEVKDAIDDALHDDSAEPTWVLDFEGTAKGFLSSQLATLFEDETEGSITTTCNVMRNFYNYLLYHDVCPEYRDDVLRARRIVDLAEPELLALKKAGHLLPGDFNTACSTLHAGCYANLDSGASWGSWSTVDEPSLRCWSQKEAKAILMAGIAAYSTEEQLEKVESAAATGFWVVTEETLGLEVTSIQHVDDNPEVKALFEDPQLTNTVVKPMGKMRCKPWASPHAPRYDLPADAVQLQQADAGLEFIIDEHTLQYCTVGMKMEATVKGLNVGLKWIDLIEATYPSFYTFLPNERIKQCKEPGPPKSWMKRQMEGKHGGMDEDQQVVVSDANDDQPD